MKTTSIPGQADLVREALARSPVPGRMLAISGGEDGAAHVFAQAGWRVSAAGFEADADRADADQGPPGIEAPDGVDLHDLGRFPDEAFDVVWAAHVLHRVLDTGRALAELRRVLKPGGRLFLTVPPFEDQLAGGHLTPGWNIGILVYVLAVAGFGLRDGRFVRHGGNLFADVGRENGPLSEGALLASSDDLERLAELGCLPQGFNARQLLDRDLASINWSWTVSPHELRPARTPARAVDGAMRISFLVPWISKGRGGTENVGQMMANAMAGRGHAVQVLTFDDHRRPSQWPLHDGIEFGHLPEDEARGNDLDMLVDIGQFGPDVIVGLHMNATFRRYIRAAKRLDLPIVLSEHIDPRFPARLGTFDPVERQIVFSGATRIHMLNEAFRDSVPPGVRDRVRVIGNTCPAPHRLATPGKAGGGVLLTVARLVQRKNVAGLIRAFAIVRASAPRWTLRIVGDGPERGRLEALARSLGVGDGIEFVGHVDDVSPHYASAHVFALPSLFEGFPMSTLEAMSHGLPLVGYRASTGLSAQIRHGENGLLSSGGSTLGSLPDDLLELARDDALRARMGEASQELYRTEFAPDHIAGLWENLFREAATDRRARARPDRTTYLDAKLDDLVWGENSRLADQLIR